MKIVKLISALISALLVLLFSSEARADETIFFRINNSDIDSGFKDNAQVLKSIEAALSSRTPSKVRIHAAASPDGPTALNTRLSRERAQAGVTLIKNICPGIADSVFVVTTTAEDIDGAVSYIGKSGKDWSDEAIKILSRGVSNPEEGLRHIHGGTVWRYLADEVFPLLRKTTIEFVFDTEPVVPVVATIEPASEGPETQISEPVNGKSSSLPWWSIALMGLLGAGAATFGGLYVAEHRKNRAMSAAASTKAAPAASTYATSAAASASKAATAAAAATVAAATVATAATAAAASSAAPETSAEPEAPAVSQAEAPVEAESASEAPVEAQNAPETPVDAAVETVNPAQAGTDVPVEGLGVAAAAAVAATAAVAGALAGEEGASEPEISSEEPEVAPEEAPEPSYFATKVYDLIDENIGNADFGVEQLAEAMGMSRIHLNRKLKAESIASPSALLKEARMKRASALIREKVLSLAEISSKCGFTTPSYFSTAFKDFYGVTPSEYK